LKSFWTYVTAAVALMMIMTGLPMHAQASPTSNLYTEDRISIQAVSGLIFSPTVFASRTMVMDYWQTNVRLGWMLNTPSDSQSFFRGNWEALLEVTNSVIYKGPGNYMGGIGAFIRYNFVQPDARIVPYFQVGGDVVYNDAYKDESQNSIGQSIEFTPQGSFGAHFLLSDHWALDAEAIFHHISNAGLDDRNRGVNAFGGFVGVTYYFEKLWK
jgi:hypothetical protein